MATYAIGDLQGCYQELLDLLDAIRYQPGRDCLWFTGDLVNRGPASLDALRFVKTLDPQTVVVLGNHDLHLLAAAMDRRHLRSKDTLEEILNAPDRDTLLHWLRSRPLLHRDTELGCTLVHAGLPPQWDLEQAQQLAREAEQVLQGPDAPELYPRMYGDQPSRWQDDLQGWERLRFTINCFTRLRFLYPDGAINLQIKDAPGRQPAPLMAWYEVPSRRSAGERIAFGHWSTVRLGVHRDFERWRVCPLDTGCVWGGSLTAMRLEDGRLFSVPSRQPKRTGE